MRLHVLGRGGGFPGPGGGCAGYLVEAAGGRVMLDCGPGTVGRLQMVCPLEALDAVVLSHAHADHVLDLVPLAYGLMIRCLTTAADRALKRIPVHLPRGTRPTIEALSRALGHPDWVFPPVPDAPPIYDAFRALTGSAPGSPPDFVFGLLPLVEYEPGDPFAVAGFAVATRAVAHGVPAAAIRFEHRGRTLAYSGDTAFCPGLVAAAAGADLFLCEATTTPDKTPYYVGHLSPREAGRAAREAGVGELVLTHVSPGADEGWLVEEAKSEFGGPTRVAHEGDAIAVGPPEEERR